MTSRPRIFISYRRTEEDGVAHLICNYLISKLGRSAVFMDIKGIMPGDVFRETIARELDTCGIMIVVIGKAWQGNTDAGATSRLHEPRDFVRYEIEAALKRGVRVIPVLVHPMKMPHKDDLPEGLRSLASIQYQELQLGQRFEHDMDRIISGMRPAGQAGRKRGLLVPIAAGAIAVTIAGVLAFDQYRGSEEKQDVAVQPADTTLPRAVEVPKEQLKPAAPSGNSGTVAVRSVPAPCALEGLEFLSEASLEDKLTLVGQGAATISISGELNRKPVDGQLRVNGGVLTVSSENGTLVSGRLELVQDCGMLKGSLTILSPSGEKLPMRVDMRNAAR